MQILARRKLSQAPDVRRDNNCFRRTTNTDEAMTTRASRNAKKPVNHRTRVGAERREKMRARLLESAFLVFARRGADATVIDEIITTAGVSRGTFYNYFHTNEELFAVVAAEVSNEILRIVDPVLQQYTDSAARIACGIRMVIELARTHAPLAAFVVRGGPSAVAAGGLAGDYLLRDIKAGMASGRFSTLHPRLAYDLVLGPVLAACHTVLTEDVPASFAEELAQAILQALGVTKSTARKFANQALGNTDIPENSLFVRADTRAITLPGD